MPQVDGVKPALSRLEPMEKRVADAIMGEFRRQLHLDGFVSWVLRGPGLPGYLLYVESLRVAWQVVRCRYDNLIAFRYVRTVNPICFNFEFLVFHAIAFRDGLGQSPPSCDAMIPSSGVPAGITPANSPRQHQPATIGNSQDLVAKIADLDACGRLRVGAFVTLYGSSLGVFSSPFLGPHLSPLSHKLSPRKGPYR
jgi:hypothetical protein